VAKLPTRKENLEVGPLSHIDVLDPTATPSGTSEAAVAAESMAFCIVDRQEIYDMDKTLSL